MPSGPGTTQSLGRVPGAGQCRQTVRQGPGQAAGNAAGAGLASVTSLAVFVDLLAGGILAVIGGPLAVQRRMQAMIVRVA